MALEQRVGTDGNNRIARLEQEDSIKDLLRQLADDGAALLRQEVALAKMEIKETASGLAMDGVRIAIALVLAILGGLALTAFLVIFLGDVVLGDNYWLSALIVGALFFIVGGVMAKSAINAMKTRSMKPEATVDTLRADSRWAKKEVDDLKRSVRS